MKKLAIILLTLVSSSAFASNVTCKVNGKEVTIIEAYSRVNSSVIGGLDITVIEGVRRIDSMGQQFNIVVCEEQALAHPTGQCSRPITRTTINIQGTLDSRQGLGLASDVYKDGYNYQIRCN